MYIQYRHRRRVEESIKGARKVLPKDQGLRFCASLHCKSTSLTNRGIELGAEDTGKVQANRPPDSKVINKFRHNDESESRCPQ